MKEYNWLDIFPRLHYITICMLEMFSNENESNPSIEFIGRRREKPSRAIKPGMGKT